MNAVRQLPDDVAALEKRRAELAGAISGLKPGSSYRRTLEARQAELARSLLRLEIALPSVSTPGAEAEPSEPSPRRPYYWEDRD